jgi:hypothetical protein
LLPYTTHKVLPGLLGAAELRRAVTENPQPGQIRYCRDVMREEMRPGDSIMHNGERDGLTIRYILPNSIQDLTIGRITK